MIASAQFTIISLCDVVTSDTPPENPYEGQLWVDTSVTPPETKIWDGNEWVVQNDIETIRTTISILTEKDAQFQQTIDGLNSYVATLTETVETVSNDQGILEERVLNSESRVSELEHTVDGLSVTMQEQYIGGINYVQNSSGLNGITDDWSYSGTVKQMSPPIPRTTPFPTPALSGGLLLTVAVHPRGGSRHLYDLGSGKENLDHVRVFLCDLQREQNQVPVQ